MADLRCTAAELRYIWLANIFDTGSFQLVFVSLVYFRERLSGADHTTIRGLFPLAAMLGTYACYVRHEFLVKNCELKGYADARRWITLEM